MSFFGFFSNLGVCLKPGTFLRSDDSHLFDVRRPRSVYTSYLPKEAAVYLGLNERTVRRWLQAGRLKWYRPDGENWQLDPTHVATYIHECANW